MEQRRHYRIPARNLKGLSVAVSRGEAVTRGVLVDVSASGAGVRLPDEAPLSLGLSDPVVLRIGAHELPEPFEVRAVTRFVSDEPGGTRYGFQFDNPDDFDRQLPESLRGLFNRRYMVRVRPHPDEPVVVTVWTLLGTYSTPQVRVRDISGIGLSLLADHHTARRLESLSRVRLTVLLPGLDDAGDGEGSGAPLDVFSRIRYRLALGPHTRLGVEFDPRTTEGFADKQHRIITYVVRRRQAEAEAALH